MNAIAALWRATEWVPAVAAIAAVCLPVALLLLWGPNLRMAQHRASTGIQPVPRGGAFYRLCRWWLAPMPVTEDTWLKTWRAMSPGKEDADVGSRG